MTDPGSGGAKPRQRRLVVLHGYDDDPSVLADAARAWCTGVDDVDVVAPSGPARTPRGRGWWTERDDGTADARECRGSIEIIAEELASANRDSREVILAGFSQGAAMAIAFLLGTTSTAPPTSLIAIAGFAPDLPAVERDAARAEGVRVLIAHGEHDASVPMANGRSLARYLERGGALVTWVSRPVGHTFTPFANDITRWMMG